eukprot:TRINITY_DN5101_c0_g1_i4.p1 TRINITY_DN5101_c0_g1~~TRINITY_DN5101_c0_g1_i4.p1  ORF type:complete len:330 (-),score=36.26 TRINITY_DN5101_c0_g1_i4:439-1392(-)
MGNRFDSPCGSRIQSRKLLSSFDLDGIAEHLRDAKNVIVLVGAGVSTSCGIPDFRTPGSGLYDNLKKYNLPRPEAMFDISYFTANPSPFYHLVMDLWPGRYKPSAAHYFIKLLSDKGILRRCYTQNIDSLETRAGVPRHELVAAHGNFDSCHVINSRTTVPPAEFHEAVGAGTAGWQALKQKYGGLVKPNIVFFGEPLPFRFVDLQAQDFKECDLLIVMGTSLVVRPFADLVGHARDDCPRLLINSKRVGMAPAPNLKPWQKLGSRKTLKKGFRFDRSDNTRDVHCESTCDDGVFALCERLGWSGDLQLLLDGKIRM